MATDVPVAMPESFREPKPNPKAGTDRSTWIDELDHISAAVLQVFASLKLTVALFAMGIFIILVGTLAQVDMNMWQVIDVYFRTWITYIPFQVFAPRSWVPNYQNIPYGFWFPGGAMIGAALFVNLFAAHLFRFKVQATGARLIAGLGVILGGAAITAFVIASGHNREGLQGEPPFSWQSLWSVLKYSLVIASIRSLYAAFRLRDKGASRFAEMAMFGGGGLVLALISAWTFLAKENAYMGDSGMRILWQLIQATFCGLVLLVGCIMVFRRRGGIVLIHSGVALMMFGQFFVSKYDVEEQMHLEEGETRSYAEDIRHTELAVIDAAKTGSEEDHVVIVPKSMLLASHSKGTSAFSQLPPGVNKDGVIHDDALAFDMRVLEYYPKADLVDASPKEKNLATAGVGLKLIATPAKPASGTDSDSAVDIAAAYVQVTKKNGGGDLGTFLLSQHLSENITIDGKSYEVSLRFRRTYKSYQITLNDVRKDDYVGTSKPRNYSSDVHLVDRSLGVDRDQIHIWMNNPLRYAGETFYQSGYMGPPDVDFESTTLSVVKNSGWMIPYVACMIVIVGLGAHFCGILVRFLRRPDAANTLMEFGTVSHGIGLVGVFLHWLHQREQEKAVAAQQSKKASGRKGPAKSKDTAGNTLEASLEPVTLSQAFRAAFPWIVVTPLVVWLIASLFPRASKDNFDLNAFGRIPVIADGRVKPLDTLARNTLRVISNKESFYDEAKHSQPAIRWLLDVIVGSADAEKHQVLRIDNLEVLDLFGLRRRKGFLYSIREIRPGAEAFNKEVDKAQQDGKTKGLEKLTTYQRKLLELDQRIHAYTRVAVAFEPPPLPDLPSPDEFDTDRASFARKLGDYRDAYQNFARGVERIHPPLIVPMKSSEPGVMGDAEGWQAYSVALPPAMVEASLLRRNPPAAVRLLNEITAAYAKGDAKKFNQSVDDYHAMLRRDKPKELVLANSYWNRNVESLFGTFYAFESFFNRVAPFFFCRFPYLLAGVLAALSWLTWREPLIRAAWWLTAFGFAVHTLALIARIYISGRPPVTNLYSSAIFIGWAAVGCCLVLDWIYRNGLAIFLSSLLGFGSLIVAHNLAADGDTFIVLEAVLDTTFWLATHVVCITLGYSTTFLAGAIGMLYILRGVFTSSLTKDDSREMARMIYGTTCFAMFFSFFGTVLGGLWADDSWGRFWGWDPKENGALIIVIWNALVLHARWGGMVKDRGLAVLSIGGNIVTSWSWFGVNQLGVGLHSYGFTQGVLQAWLIFVASQVIVIVLGCIPRDMWMSDRDDSGKPEKVGLEPESG